MDLLRVALGSRIQPNASRINAVEEEHRGMINKYLSDGFMAIFGAGDSGSNHPRDAVSAGCEILRAVKGLNDELAAKERAQFKLELGFIPARRLWAASVRLSGSSLLHNR